MAGIKSILKQATWTGRDIGRVELTNMAVHFAAVKQGKKGKDIVDQADFKHMVDTLRDPVQRATYNNYIDIHRWINVFFNMAQGQLMQTQLAFRTIEGYIREAIIAEDIYKYVCQLPAIMTKKQLEDTKAAGIEAYATVDGKEAYCTAFDLLDLALDYYLELLVDEPGKPNPLKAVKKKYVKEPVASKLILDRWNVLTGQGYYTLADGRRSDKMTKQELSDAIDQGNKEHLQQGVKTYLETGENLDTAANLPDDLFIEGAEWHYSSKPPKGLTKWQALEELHLSELYPADLDKLSGIKNGATRDCFIEFSELVEALTADLEERYKLKLKKLPLVKWREAFITKRQLYKMDFLSEKRRAESYYLTLDPTYRVFNGIAIIDARPSQVDKNGYYKEPEITKGAFNRFSLEGFFPNSNTYAFNADNMEDCKEKLLDSYYFLLGYNYTLDRIAAFHGVAEVAIFKVDLDALGQRIDAFNALVPLLFETIKDTPYKDKELQEKKKQVLRDHFNPVWYKKLEIPADSKQRADELIQNFVAFNQDYRDEFIQLLFRRPVVGSSKP